MQKMIEVYKEGVLWFEFPDTNENAVREMLMKKGVDRVCTFREKGVDDKAVTAKIKSKLKTVNL